MAVPQSSSAKNHLQAQVAPPQIWWANAVFFILVHIAAFVGLYHIPPWSVRKETLLLWFLTWQLSDFGITIGYHRLYSHKAFRATLAVRVVLAILGSCAFQGSIKWWCLRHRLHHVGAVLPAFIHPSHSKYIPQRFTDDPIHDPYAATRGLFYSHMGWIFYKPTYERMGLVERDDLENDPVVRIQHRYYVPLALFCGFICPIIIAQLWGDPLGGFVWGGLVARLFIWHCTFLVNSIAHWDGLQPYSDEDTSRGNLLLALLTGGEGNHNFHSFPHDFRSGPSITDWDPSKWIILAFQKLGMASSLRRARTDDLLAAIQYMKQKEKIGYYSDPEDQTWDGESWDINQVVEYAKFKPGECIILIDGYVVNVTPYLREHPGGAGILRAYSIRGSQIDENKWKKGDWAFNGGVNNHSRNAKQRMKALRVAKVTEVSTTGE